MSRREIVMVERPLSKRNGYTAFVKMGASEVTLHGRRYARTGRLTEAGIPVFRRVVSVLGTGEPSSTEPGAPKPLTTVVITEERTDAP